MQRPCSTSVPATYVGQQQVEQTPQLLQLILQGGASQQQAAQGGEAVQITRQLALPVLHALRLINDDILPLDLQAIGIKSCLCGREA